MESLSNIIFESINEDFGYGMYGPFKVIIMKKNGYVNATKLCDDGGKHFYHWVANDYSKELISFVEEEQKNRSHGNPWSVQIVVKTGENAFRGTYLCQDLIPHVASWVSAEFAIKVSRIVNEYIVSEFKKQLEKKDEHIKSLREDVVVKAENRRKKQNFHLIRFDGCVAPRYKMIRGQNPNIPIQYKKLEGINYTILQKFEDIPNGVNYGNRLKERLGIKFCADLSFILPPQLDEATLKSILNKIHEERLLQ